MKGRLSLSFSSLEVEDTRASECWGTRVSFPLNFIPGKGNPEGRPNVGLCPVVSSQKMSDQGAPA